MSRRSWIVITVIAAAVLVGGCGSSEDTTVSAPTTTTTQKSLVVTSTTTTTTTTPPPLLNRRGENGQVFQADGLVGWADLRIINEENKDYAIVVTNGDPKTPQAIIYVHANSEATLSGTVGTYFVYLKSGTDWDEATLSFTRNRRFEKFDQPFDEDTNWELSLKPSPDGNATTSDVPAF